MNIKRSQKIKIKKYSDSDNSSAFDQVAIEEPMEIRQDLADADALDRADRRVRRADHLAARSRFHPGQADRDLHLLRGGAAGRLRPRARDAADPARGRLRGRRPAGLAQAVAQLGRVLPCAGGAQRGPARPAQL